MNHTACSRPLAIAVAAVLLALGPPVARAVTAADLLAGYSAQAGVAAQPVRGQQLFTTRQGREWSCASCHGMRPVAGGRHAGTGKAIEALAPAVNPRRFVDAARTEKWFRRNCNDVLGRPCSAAEKADVLAWLITLEP